MLYAKITPNCNNTKVMFGPIQCVLGVQKAESADHVGGITCAHTCTHPLFTFIKLNIWLIVIRDLKTFIYETFILWSIVCLWPKIVFVRVKKTNGKT